MLNYNYKSETRISPDLIKLAETNSKANNRVYWADENLWFDFAEIKGLENLEIRI